MNRVPKLVRGPAFHLEGDGRWDVQELPDSVLREAEYSGEIDIEGFPAVVFELPSGDQWAQKSPGTPAPKGDDGPDPLAQIAARVAKAASASISDPFLKMGKRVVAKVELERGQLRSVQGLLEELSACRAALDKAVQHSRVLKADASFEWIYDQLESKKEELDGLATGIRESLEYMTRMDLG